jgi:sec-independent protein translocase protein TatA
MTGALSPTHWLVILVVVLLLFGAKRMPDAARGIGRSLRIFKAETKGLREDDDAKDGGATAASQPRAVEGTVVDRPQDGAATSRVPDAERDR